jgi:hypothetical protein
MQPEIETGPGGIVQSFIIHGFSRRDEMARARFLYPVLFMIPCDNRISPEIEAMCRVRNR